MFLTNSNYLTVTKLSIGKPYWSTIIDDAQKIPYRQPRFFFASTMKNNTVDYLI